MQCSIIFISEITTVNILAYVFFKFCDFFNIYTDTVKNFIYIYIYSNKTKVGSLCSIITYFYFTVLCH